MVWFGIIKFYEFAQFSSEDISVVRQNTTETALTTMGFKAYIP